MVRQVGRLIRREPNFTCLSSAHIADKLRDGVRFFFSQAHKFRPDPIAAQEAVFGTVDDLAHDYVAFITVRQLQPDHPGRARRQGFGVHECGAAARYVEHVDSRPGVAQNIGDRRFRLKGFAKMPALVLIGHAFSNGNRFIPIRSIDPSPQAISVLFDWLCQRLSAIRKTRGESLPPTVATREAMIVWHVLS